MLEEVKIFNQMTATHVELTEAFIEAFSGVLRTQLNIYDEDLR